ncbi:hypothetical protein HDZ31DRAFT_70755 [Schizophyllum fasciatum]
MASRDQQPRALFTSTSTQLTMALLLQLLLCGSRRRISFRCSRASKAGAYYRPAPTQVVVIRLGPLAITPPFLQL